MRIAAVDIGTNTVRLLVATPVMSEGTVVEWIDHREAVTRLGEGVDADGLLTAEAMGRTLAVLAGYREAIKRHRADAVVAVATSATRDAANRDEFLDRAERALGYRPSVITGDAEAELAFLGTTNGATGDRPYLVIDLGGGSTEFVFGKSKPDLTMSIDIGSVRLTERRLPDRPASVGQVAAARSEARRLIDAVQLPEDPGCVIGVGGTFTTLGALAGSNTLEASALGDIIERLRTMTIADTASLREVHARRAEVLLGGAIVAEQALLHLDRTAVHVSRRDMLDGMILEAAGRER